MTTLPPCKLCDGSRHKLDPAKGIYVSCECLKLAKSIERYRVAGIPARATDETWRTFLATWKPSDMSFVLSVALSWADRKKTPDEFVMLYGTPEGRDLAAALLIRAACDGHRSASMTDLSKLIAHEFGRDEAEGSTDPYTVGVMCLTLGREAPHKWNKNILEKTLRTRWSNKLPTVVAVHGDPSRIGANYHSGSVDDILSRFTRVSVYRKEKA